LPGAALRGQATRVEAGIGVVVPTRLRLAEPFEDKGAGPRFDIGLSMPIGAGALRWQFGGTGQRIKAGRDYIRTFAGTVGLGADLRRGPIVPTAAITLVPHWTQYSRRFALHCDVPVLGGQNGFDPTVEPDCTGSKAGVGAQVSGGVRFSTLGGLGIGLELQGIHLPGVSTAVAVLVRVTR
jgi:hypothetical protein